VPSQLDKNIRPPRRSGRQVFLQVEHAALARATQRLAGRNRDTAHKILGWRVKPHPPFTGRMKQSQAWKN
jgi:hypothetical protein